MQMIPVRSSAISAVGYDPEARHMAIQFTSGRTYTFCRVHPNVYEGLMAASSKGNYYDQHVRERYQC